MNNSIKVSIAIAFSLLILSCNHSASIDDPITEHRPILDSIYAFLNELNESPGSFSGKTVGGYSEYFNRSQYLSIDSGFVLDFVYCNEANSYPVVYRRQVNEEPLDSVQQVWAKYPFEKENCVYQRGRYVSELDALLDGQGFDSLAHLEYRECFERNDLKRYRYGIDIENDIFSCVIVKPDPNGLFEFVSFRFLSGMFGLGWHSNYWNKWILTEEKFAKTLIDSVGGRFDDPVRDSLMTAIDSTNFKPMISINDSTVAVSFIAYKFKYGLFRRTEILEKQSPYKILDYKEELIASGRLPYCY